MTQSERDQWLIYGVCETDNQEHEFLTRDLQEALLAEKLVGYNEYTESVYLTDRGSEVASLFSNVSNAVENNICRLHCDLKQETFKADMLLRKIGVSIQNGNLTTRETELYYNQTLVVVSAKKALDDYLRVEEQPL